MWASGSRLSNSSSDSLFHEVLCAQGGLKQYLPRTLVNSGVGTEESLPRQSATPTVASLRTSFVQVARQTRLHHKNPPHLVP